MTRRRRGDEPRADVPVVVELPLDQIIVSSHVQIRDGLKEWVVQRYVESFEHLPPVVVFAIPDESRRLLADGFHRVAAARRLGRPSIRCEIRPGTREDALEYAVRANVTNAEPLRAAERDAGIRRLRQLHPEWSLRQVAEAMSTSHETIRRVFHADEVKQAVEKAVTAVTAHDDAPPSPSLSLSTRQYSEIARAPWETWPDLARLAADTGAGSRTLAAAADRLNDAQLDEGTKQAVLAGAVDPFRLERVDPRRGRRPTPARAFVYARRYLKFVRSHATVRDIVAYGAKSDALDAWCDTLPAEIAFLTAILEAVGAATERREEAR